MRILGLTFVGSRTHEREAMSTFVRHVLGLESTTSGGMDAEVFALPDGSTFAVTSPDGPDDTERTVGFLVDDIEAAVTALRAAGALDDEEIATNDTQRYVHFRGPDGHLYELVQELGAS